MSDAFIPEDEELLEEPEFLKRDNRRARRRAINASKARRKRSLSRAIYHLDWYKHLHQYSKGKIHCSCNLCRFRPKWDPDNKPMQDIRNLEDIREQLNAYNTAEEV